MYVRSEFKAMKKADKEIHVQKYGNPLYACLSLKLWDLICVPLWVRPPCFSVLLLMPHFCYDVLFLVKLSGLFLVLFSGLFDLLCPCLPIGPAFRFLLNLIPPFCCSDYFVRDTYVLSFLIQWKNYVELLESQTSVTGKDMDLKTRKMLSPDQKKNLKKLKKAAKE